MYRGESTDTEEEVSKAIENSLRDVSLSSIKTQDSIENNLPVVGLEEEERKDEGERVRMVDAREHRVQLAPFLSLKETQHVILRALEAPRVRLEIKPLHDILTRVHKLTEDFQEWRKHD